MVKEVNFEDVKRDVIHAFTNGCMCSESVITIANKHNGHRNWIPIRFW